MPLSPPPVPLQTPGHVRSVFSPPPAVTAHLRAQRRLISHRTAPGTGPTSAAVPRPRDENTLPAAGFVSGGGCSGVPAGVPLLAPGRVTAPGALPSQRLLVSPHRRSALQLRAAGTRAGHCLSPEPQSPAQPQVLGNHPPRAGSAARARLGTRCRPRASPRRSVTHRAHRPGCWHCPG